MNPQITTRSWYAGPVAEAVDSLLHAVADIRERRIAHHRRRQSAAIVLHEACEKKRVNTREHG